MGNLSKYSTKEISVNMKITNFNFIYSKHKKTLKYFFVDISLNISSTLIYFMFQRSIKQNHDTKIQKKSYEYFKTFSVLAIHLRIFISLQWAIKRKIITTIQRHYKVKMLIKHVLFMKSVENNEFGLYFSVRGLLQCDIPYVTPTHRMGNKSIRCKTWLWRPPAYERTPTTTRDTFSHNDQLKSSRL